MVQDTTKFLLDSGDPDEYREIQSLAEKAGSVLWGGTTNPSLIAKKLAGKKVSLDEANQLQTTIVKEILSLLPGAVSAEVYADSKTTAKEMIEQGRELSTIHPRVYVKLPTTVEGLKARTQLRKEKIKINNTLVFSQEQIYAICLHEWLIQKHHGPTDDMWPPFISPFLGRLDDIGIDGCQLVEHGMNSKRQFHLTLPKTVLAIWMLASSLRNTIHMKRMIQAQVEIITAPAKVYREWFSLSREEQETLDDSKYAKALKPLPVWEVPQSIKTIDSFERFFEALEKKRTGYNT